jgi:hypothetical protein
MTKTPANDWQEIEVLPRFNHSVPQFILNYFSRDGKICVFDKHSLKEFKLPPNRAMGERDFHNIYFDDLVVSFENRFTHVENLAAPIISEIVQTKSLTNLSPMDLGTLHIFVALQLTRSKAKRLDQDAVLTEIKRRWPDATLNPFPDRIADSELGKLSSLKIAFDNLDKFAEPLVLKHLFLMIRDCRDDVYISDNPVVMHNQSTYGPYGNLGLAVPGIEIYFPLSPDVTLAYLCPTALARVEAEQAKAEKQVSSLFATKMLRSGLSPADTAEFNKMRAAIKRSRDHYRLLKEHRVVPMDAQNVLFLNSLQLRSSYRFVAASRSNFAFARRCLSERPHWKEGMRVQVA